jgi:glucan-binding YG repeat protein
VTPGNYKIKLFVIDGNGKSSKEYATLNMSVTQEQATAIAAEFVNIPFGWYSDTIFVETTNEEGVTEQAPTQIWHYRKANGILAQAEWVSENKIAEDGSNLIVWYYIKADGTMACNEWIESNGKSYYLTDTGAMLVNGKTPDGATVNENGEKVS